MAHTPRPAREHRTTAREAGLGRVSLLSILAGTLCAYGAFAILAAVAGSILSALDVDTEFRTDDWASSGLAAGIVSGLVLLVSYLFGGYVAGRMARRSGLLHGLGVVLLSLVLGGIVGAIAGAADDSGVADNLRSVGVPTSWDQVKGVAIASAIISLVGLVVGGLLGGILGERWHTKLARRVNDPDVGPAADARRDADHERERAAELDRRHDERVGHDTVVAAEARRLSHDRDGEGVDDGAEHDRDRDGRDDRTEVRTAPPAAVDVRDDWQQPAAPRPGWPGAAEAPQAPQAPQAPHQVGPRR